MPPSAQLGFVCGETSCHPPCLQNLCSWNKRVSKVQWRLSWWLSVKKSTCNAGAAGDVGSGLGSGRSYPGIEVGMVTHSSILTWRIPWTEDPGGLQSIGSGMTETTYHTLKNTRKSATGPRGEGSEAWLLRVLWCCGFRCSYNKGSWPSTGLWPMFPSKHGSFMEM